MVEATGWSEPTANTFLGRVVRRRLGLNLTSIKPVRGEQRVYRITDHS